MKIWKLVLLDLLVVCGLSQEISDFVLDRVDIQPFRDQELLKSVDPCSSSKHKLKYLEGSLLTQLVQLRTFTV